jgi:hypothetical protein
LLPFFFFLLLLSTVNWQNLRLLSNRILEVSCLLKGTILYHKFNRCTLMIRINSTRKSINHCAIYFPLQNSSA